MRALELMHFVVTAPYQPLRNIWIEAFNHVRGVEACGTEGNASAAWIAVKESGLVSFFNYEGSTSTCAFDNGLKHGSRCDASDSKSSTKSLSALTTPKSSSTVSGSSSTTLHTSPSPSCFEV
ncbi:unnamed protein product [Penicillium camemberti]|uniref:Str. FM013 n=1 Tax=Penicillium camemberti (strain FM 013) TaxID=1429867 RepID=A0A0G4PWW1_PENC3|nr:unnamed protein product [Penicillium camemberti]